MPEVVVTGVTANEQEHILAAISSGGVLKELALSRWRGLTPSHGQTPAGQAEWNGTDDLAALGLADGSPTSRDVLITGRIASGM
jgi:hypothetical protein